MTSFHPTDRPLHKLDGTHRVRSPRGADPAKFRAKLERHMLRHDLEGATVPTPLDPDYELIREASGRAFGRLVADLLRNRDMTQPEIAKLLGISTSALKQKIQGVNAFTLPEAVFIARQTGANAHDIIVLLAFIGDREADGE